MTSIMKHGVKEIKITIGKLDNGRHTIDIDLGDMMIYLFSIELNIKTKVE